MEEEIRRICKNHLVDLKASISSEIKASIISEFKETFLSELKASAIADLKSSILADLRAENKAGGEESKTTQRESVFYIEEKISDENKISQHEAFERLGGESELLKHKKNADELVKLIGDGGLDAEVKRFLPRDFRQRRGFSTKLNYQPFISSLDELYEQADAVFPRFRETVEDLAKQTEGKALVPKMKSKLRSRMKALHKYFDSDQGIAWYRLTDVVRATIQYESIAQLYSGLDATVKHFGNAVKELNDRYQSPMEGGYRDIQLVVCIDDHMCELQLNTRLMLQAKQSTGHRNYQVVRELKAAIADGDLSRVEGCIEFGRSQLGSCAGSSETAFAAILGGEEAKTLIHEAAKNDSAEIIYALLTSGADENVQDDIGNTPLHYAILLGSDRCVWVLLNVGRPNLDLKNADGQTALDVGYLMIWQRPSELKLRALMALIQYAGVDRFKVAQAATEEHLRKRLCFRSALVDHTKDGNINLMLQELRNYADPDSTRDDVSALEVALETGNVAAVELLLDFHASLETRDGKRPYLQTAMESRKPETFAKMLIDAKAPTDVGPGNKPLLMVANRQRSIAKMLLDAGAPILAYKEVHVSEREYKSVFGFNTIAEASGKVEFTVHMPDVTPTDAPHIALGPSTDISDGSHYKIVLGGVNNQQSAIHGRAGKLAEHMGSAQKPGAKFRVSWNQATLVVERFLKSFSATEWETLLHLDRTMPDAWYDIRHMMVSSFDGNKVIWKISMPVVQELDLAGSSIFSNTIVTPTDVYQFKHAYTFGETSISSGSICFDVDAIADANIALGPSLGQDDPKYEIVLGDCDNERCIIREENGGKTLCVCDGGMLEPGTPCRFRLSWTPNELCVERRFNTNEEEGSFRWDLLMSLDRKTAKWHDIRYMMVTSWNCNITWRIHETLDDNPTFIAALKLMTST